jgi:serine/threonine-protein kinase
MAVPASTRLGPYEVLTPLGAGGMGEVYRARDTRLNREVALKVLPEAFAADPERMARFEREARVLAALNHPNIAAIHGFEDSHGKRAIIMELVPGLTLAERLSAGAIPLGEALPIANQLAEALEYAHECGVIHRDLKPANIKITPEGRVKVLDFGLAKALDVDDSGSSYDAAASPTLTISATHAGVLMGTAAYMSPEQARGQASDKRSDIWGFGVIVYELLTGRQAFPGETISDTLASILKSDPDWQALPPGTPAPILRLLRRCMERDRKLRLHDIGDAQLEIREALNAAPEATTAPLPVTRPTRTGSLVAAMISVLVLITLAWLIMRSTFLTSRPLGSEQLIRFRVAVPGDGFIKPATHSSNVAVSANGERLVYITGTSGNNELVHRSLASADPVVVRFLRGDLKAPFLSPDGQWIGIFNTGKLKKVPVSGGPIETVCDVSSGHGGTWNRQGLIVFTASHSSGLSSVSDRGGPIRTLTTPKIDGGELAHYWPYFLPDDKTVLFTVIPRIGVTFDQARIESLRIDTGERRLIVQGGYAPRYLSSGHLVYARGGAMMMAPFDATKLSITGPAIKVLEGVRIDPFDPPDFDVSLNGVMVYVPGKMFIPETRLVLADRTGATEDLTDINEPYVDGPKFSPDGNRIAFSIGAEQSDVWTYDLRPRVLTRITHDGASTAPAWSPDGRQIVFHSTNGATTSMFLAGADGHGEPALLTTRRNMLQSSFFRPDGRVIGFVEYDPHTLFDIWLLPLEGDRKPRPFLQTPAYETHGAFAPSSRYIAYFSTESSSGDVYIQALDGPGKWRVSRDGGGCPVWSSDGRELFYIAGRSLNVVTISAGPDPTPGTSRRLFEMNSGGSYGVCPYDIAPNGQRFVLVRGAQNPPPSNVFEVLVNWNPATR